MEDHRLELLRLTPHQRAEAKNKADSAFLAQLALSLPLKRSSKTRQAMSCRQP